jgi:hypothetical protein
MSTVGGRGGRYNTRGTRGGRGNGQGGNNGNGQGGNNHADGYNDTFSVFDSAAIPRVEVDEPELRHMKEMLHLYDEALDNATRLDTVARCKLLINSPDMAIIGNTLQDSSEDLLNLHQKVVELRQSISARCEPAMERVRALEAEQHLRTSFSELQGRMMQAVGYGTAGAAGGGSPGGQDAPGNNGAGFGNLGFGSNRPRMDIPKMLPPEAYTGEMKDGVKQDAKNFMTDVKLYIEDAPAYQSDAAKIRFAINYFRSTFADEWKARLEHGDITPGFDSTDATRMDFALFEEWFLTHTQDLAASIRHRNECFSYTGMGVPVDQVLHMAQMLQQRCNQHTESPQDHVTQSQFWDKVSNLLDRETIKLCLVDPVTTTHPLHKNIPPYTVIEKHVKDFLRLQ